MADSRNHSDSTTTTTDIYERVLSLSTKMRSYYQCKSSPYVLTEIKHELQSTNKSLKEGLTLQEREIFDALIATTPEIVKHYVAFADVLFSGKLTLCHTNNFSCHSCMVYS